jgi:hypothetical protein
MDGVTAGATVRLNSKPVTLMEVPGVHSEP